jgi:hypothetical protein
MTSYLLNIYLQYRSPFEPSLLSAYITYKYYKRRKQNCNYIAGMICYELRDTGNFFFPYELAVLNRPTVLTAMLLAGTLF